MLFSFLGKAEGGKELCSGGGNIAQGGVKSQGAPPSVSITGVCM